MQPHKKYKTNFTQGRAKNGSAFTFGRKEVQQYGTANL
jgi:hypothetical protein